MGESVVVPQTQNENASKKLTPENGIRVEEIPGESDERNAPAHNQKN